MIKSKLSSFCRQQWTSADGDTSPNPMLCNGIKTWGREGTRVHPLPLFVLIPITTYLVYEVSRPYNPTAWGPTLSFSFLPAPEISDLLLATLGSTLDSKCVWYFTYSLVRVKTDSLASAQSILADKVPHDWITFLTHFQITLKKILPSFFSSTQRLLGFDGIVNAGIDFGLQAKILECKMMCFCELSFLLVGCLDFHRDARRWQDMQRSLPPPSFSRKMCRWCYVKSLTWQYSLLHLDFF